jgi:Spy/CpxP family protein refolding chaperone
MKKRNAALGAVLWITMFSTGFSLQAQSRAGKGFRGNMPDSTGVQARVERMTADLSLDQTQKAKLMKLEQAHYTEMRARRSDMHSSREAHRAEVEKIREQHKADLKQILTEEQYARWEATHQQRVRERRHDGSGQGRGGERMRGNRGGGNY